MVVVAVAGGTGHMGRTIVEAFIADGKHTILILGRNPNPALEAELGVPIIAVDYSDISAVTKTLEGNNVHTAISAINMSPFDGSTPTEIELIRAADASKTTKRMITSDWGVPHKDEHLAIFPSAARKRDAQAVLAKVTDLETTRFCIGYFLDYWGFPRVKSYMGSTTFVVDVANDVAGIPGTGDVPVTFSHSVDVAQFVVRSLDLQKWDPISWVVGDKVTWNEFLWLAEEAKGAKFTVTYDSVESLTRGEATELPNHLPMYIFLRKEVFRGMAAMFSMWFDDGFFNLNPKKKLNDEFPDIKLRTVKEVLNAAWKTT
ncbi:hypothetical protein B0H63DRAFT_551718 [Podospora didyma]|uniref:NmrA-like domain-containing protein n=1 Tax=Podospora didyma TaxID=330526 RepID=A0AAE0K4E1_9PEZI|nr:hypothetical protein B0H63DRAFT_551718 [Podospora didyma]